MNRREFCTSGLFALLGGQAASGRQLAELDIPELRIGTVTVKDEGHRRIFQKEFAVFEDGEKVALLVFEGKNFLGRTLQTTLQPKDTLIWLSLENLPFGHPSAEQNHYVDMECEKFCDNVKYDSYTPADVLRIATDLLLATRKKYYTEIILRDATEIIKEHLENTWGKKITIGSE